MADKAETMRKRFRKLMSDNALTAQDVADMTGYAQQTIRAFRCGAREVKPRAMKALENSLSAK